MNTAIILLLFIVGCSAAGIIGWYFGMYKERLAWNELIEKNLIPEPSRKNTYKPRK